MFLEYGPHIPAIFNPVWFRLVRVRYNGVHISLYHHDDLPEELYAQLLEPLSAKDGYLRTVVDQSFSAEEVNQLREYSTQFSGVEFRTEPMTPIEPGEIGYGALPAGGGTDHYMFTKDNPSPPVPVWGYYDIRHLEPAGPVDPDEVGAFKEFVPIYGFVDATEQDTFGHFEMRPDGQGDYFCAKGPRSHVEYPIPGSDVTVLVSASTDARDAARLLRKIAGWIETQDVVENMVQKAQEQRALEHEDGEIPF